MKRDSDVDIIKKIEVQNQESSSPTKYHDTNDPFYDNIRSKHPRSLNYHDQEVNNTHYIN